MTSLTHSLSDIVGAAFAQNDLPADLGRVSVSDRPDLCQFQCNGALAAAKIAKKNPREIAQSIVDVLNKNEIFSEISIAGPGFVNLTLTDAYLNDALVNVSGDERFGVALPDAPKTVVLDFGGPNVAKPMHVGHLRSSIIGDALQRLFRFAGDKTIGDVHLGDWGTQMGQLITGLEREQPDLPYFDEAFEGDYPETPPLDLAGLEVLYPKASAACKEDPELQEQARLATRDLQAGRKGYRVLWQSFVDVSLPAMEREFGSLGVQFDLWKGESHVNGLIPDMVASMKQQGIAEENDGALVVRVAQEGDKAEIPPLILLKSDGSVMYGSTDVATIVDRVNEYDPDLILYVVDQRQYLHFDQVFRTTRKAGMAGKAELEHIGFGTMNGSDGKPFKTRAGGVMKLYDLLEMGCAQALSRIEEAGLATDYDDGEKQEIARMVGLGAIKFADLSNQRQSNYVFDLERFTSFEGKTGPYLQYASVRIKSILRRVAEEFGEVATGPLLLEEEAERALGLELLGLSDAIESAYDKRAPHILCDYAYTLAQAFSRFYAAHHILSEKREDLRISRVTLCQMALGQLTLVLGLLGIEVPERM